jgi:hypothetical protein
MERLNNIFFFTKADSIAADRRIINANFYLFDTKGVFLSAYQMRNGVITHKLVPKRKGSYRIIDNNGGFTTGKSGMPICGTCTLPFSDNFFYYWEDPYGEENEKSGGRNCIELDPVTVIGIGGGNKKINRTPNFPNYPYYDYLPINNWEENYDRRHEEDDDIWAKRRKFQNSSNIGAGMAKEEEKKEEKKQDKREDTIKDSLTTPCAKALLAQAPTLANDIATLLNNTFGTNDCFNITFVQESLKDDTDGNTKYIYVSDTKDVIDIKITLNSKMLNTATNEYILATIYHEVLHAYFNVELAKLDFDNKKFEQKYPGAIIHNATGLYTYKERNVTKSVPYSKIEFVTEKKGHLQLVPFIDKLAKAIQSYNSNIPTDVAKAIARMGIVQGKDMLDWEIAYNINERTGNNNRKGTKCTP